jgi:hypothetical protein
VYIPSEAWTLGSHNPAAPHLCSRYGEPTDAASPLQMRMVGTMCYHTRRTPGAITQSDYIETDCRGASRRTCTASALINRLSSSHHVATCKRATASSRASSNDSNASDADTRQQLCFIRASRVSSLTMPTDVTPILPTHPSSVVLSYRLVALHAGFHCGDLGQGAYPHVVQAKTEEGATSCASTQHLPT